MFILWALVKSPEEPKECVVLLADRRLLELPLEALSIMQEDGLCSVSRDFTLQLLHSRLIRAEAEKGTRNTRMQANFWNFKFAS